MFDNENVCRTCLSPNVPKVSILEVSNEPVVSSIKDMLMECVSIYVSPEDNLPKLICNKCLEILEISYNFKVQCKKTEEILLSLQESKASIEGQNQFIDNVEEIITKVDPEQIAAKLKADDEENENNDNIFSEIFDDTHFVLQPESKATNSKRLWKSGEENNIKRLKRQKKRKQRLLSSLKRQRKLKRKVNDDVKKEMSDDNDDKQFVCIECDVSYATKNSLNRHNREKHLENKYMCNICNKGFMHHKVYFKHRIKHGFPCRTCFEIFEDQVSLQNHSVKHEGHLKFVCKECGKEFQRAEKLFSHYKMHAEKTEQHLCTICGKVAPSSSNLLTHMKSHEKKRFVCKTCGKTYRAKASWRYHLLSHDPDRKHTYIVCNICGKLFKTKSNLQRHSIIHVENRIKKHGCTYCEKRFDRGGDLKTHLRIHTGERPYACTVCDMKFTQPNVLKNHLKIHEISKS